MILILNNDNDRSFIDISVCTSNVYRLKFLTFHGLVYTLHYRPHTRTIVRCLQQLGTGLLSFLSMVVVGRKWSLLETFVKGNLQLGVIELIRRWLQ